MKQWHFWFLIGTIKEATGYIAEFMPLIAVGISIQIACVVINVMGWEGGAE